MNYADCLHDLKEFLDDAELTEGMDRQSMLEMAIEKMEDEENE